MYFDDLQIRDPGNSFVSGKVVENKLYLLMSLVYFWVLLGFLVIALGSYIFWQHPHWFDVVAGSSDLKYCGFIILNLLLIIPMLNINNFYIKLAIFILFNANVGLALSPIFFVYDLSSILCSLVVTAVAFSALSIFGWVTQINLKKIGTFCFIGLIGLVVICFSYWFKPSLYFSELGLAEAIFGLLVFAGLTAHDTQTIKSDMLDSFTMSNNINVLCLTMNESIELILDFINFFLRMLRIFGKRK